MGLVKRILKNRSGGRAFSNKTVICFLKCLIFYAKTGKPEGSPEFFLLLAESCLKCCKLFFKLGGNSVADESVELFDVFNICEPCLFVN